MFRKLPNKDIDLLVVYYKKTEPSKYHELLKFMALPMVLVFLFALVFGYLKLEENRVIKDIQKVNEEIEIRKAEQSKDGKVEKFGQLETLRSDIEEIKLIYANMTSYPVLSKNIIDAVYQACGSLLTLKELSYTQGEGLLTLTLETADVKQSDKIIRRLKDTELFEDVAYRGYTSRDVEISSEIVPSQTLEGEALTQALIQQLLGKPTTKIEPKVSYKVYTIQIHCVLKKVEEAE